MYNFFRPHTKPESKRGLLNITPFVDVLLVLLGFFILIIHHQERDPLKYIYVELPIVNKLNTDILKKQKNIAQDKKIIPSGCIDKNGDLTWSYQDERGVLKKSSEQNIGAFLTLLPEIPEHILLRVDKNTAFETVLKHVTDLKQYGVHDIGFAVNNESIHKN